MANSEWGLGTDSAHFFTLEYTVRHRVHQIFITQILITQIFKTEIFKTRFFTNFSQKLHQPWGRKIPYENLHGEQETDFPTQLSLHFGTSRLQIGNEPLRWPLAPRILRTDERIQDGLEAIQRPQGRPLHLPRQRWTAQKRGLAYRWCRDPRQEPRSMRIMLVLQYHWSLGRPTFP